MLFAVSLGVVLALLVNVCLMLLLRCAGLSSITLGGWQLDTEQPTGLAGERFTRAMGAKSVAWAGLLLIVLYGTSVVYCAAAKNTLSWEALYKVWRHWDAGHYLALAEKGYRDSVEDGQHLFLAYLPPLVYAARHMPEPWAVYLTVCLLMNYSISWPLSCRRYMACAFPLFATAAAALRRRPGLAQGAMFFVYLSGGHVY